LLSGHTSEYTQSLTLISYVGQTSNSEN